MKRLDAERFFNQPCKFKLKSGKEIFGVIWDWLKENEDKVEYYFASNGEVIRYRQQTKQWNAKPSPQIGQIVNLDDIIYAEQIHI